MQNYRKTTSDRLGKPVSQLYPSKRINTAAFALALAICSAAQAQETNISTNGVSTSDGVSRLSEVLVEGREDSLIGVVDTASAGTVGAGQIEQRPIARSAEILETVPGLIVTQHSGAGKANQFFMRGF